MAADGEWVEVIDTTVEMDGEKVATVTDPVTGHITATIRVRDMQRTKLFVHELETLIDEMRVMASPHAERLERAVARFANGGDDEGEEA